MNKKAAMSLLLAPMCALALAQGPSPLEMQRVGAAAFVCGGVGTGEQEAIKAQAPSHDLMLTFAVSTGAYLADVEVQIRDAKGAVVLSATCGGPIMLVDLPARASWHVTARANGQAREKTVTAGGGTRAQATFTWPAGNS